MTDLFDNQLRAARRDRAFRSGPAMYLYERAFADILDRLSLVRRKFERALLIGTPDPSWPARLSAVTKIVTAFDPGAKFAQAAGGRQADENSLAVEPGSFDLCVAAGTLDSVNDLPGALLRIRFALKPDSLLIGAIPGGDTLPRLRRAMRAADTVSGVALPHVHPRIEPSALGRLLAAAGFQMPVVDVDRVAVAYGSLGRLVGDLRAMGVTNILNARPRAPLGRPAFQAAYRNFESGNDTGRTTETFELLHFAAWTAP